MPSALSVPWDVPSTLGASTCPSSARGSETPGALSPSPPHSSPGDHSTPLLPSLAHSTPQHTPLHTPPAPHQAGEVVSFAEAEEPTWLTNAAIICVASTRSDATGAVAGHACPPLRREASLMVQGSPVGSEAAKGDCDEPEWLTEAAEAVSMLETCSATAVGEWAKTGAAPTASHGLDSADAEALAAQAALSRAMKCVKNNSRNTRYSRAEVEETRAAFAEAEVRLARMRALSQETIGCQPEWLEKQPEWLEKATNALTIAKRVSGRSRSVVQGQQMLGIETPTGHPVVTGRLVPQEDVESMVHPIPQPAEGKPAAAGHGEASIGLPTSVRESRSWSRKFALGGVGFLAIATIAVIAVGAPLTRRTEGTLVALTNTAMKVATPVAFAIAACDATRSKSRK